MPREIRLTRTAARQIDEAATWWTHNRPAAPEAFADELFEVYELISAHPRVGAIATNAKLSGVRRVHLSRVRYHLYHREVHGIIQILALWHTSRGSEPL